MVKPKKTYFISVVGVSLAEGIPWMLEQTASSSEFWQKIPFGWLAVCFLFFLLGQLVQDFSNKDSWLRKNWRSLNRLADISALHAKIFQENPEMIGVFLKFNYIRTIKNGEIIITVIPQHNDAAGQPFVIYHENNISCPPYSDKEIRICSLRVPKPNQEPIHSLWGEEIGSVELKDGQQTVVPTSKNLVVLEIKTKNRAQQFEFVVCFKNPLSGYFNPIKDSPVHITRLDEVIDVQR